MVVATNAVAKHAMMTDANVVCDRVSAWFNSVTVVRIAPGMDLHVCALTALLAIGRCACVSA